MTEGLLDKGKFSHSGAKTLIEDQTINLQAEYEFLDKGYILLVKNYMHYCKELIETANRLDKWTEATLANSPDRIYKDTNMRSSKNVLIAHSVHQDLKVFETVLGDSFHACLQLYLMKNTFAKVTADTGYEMLKYDVGGRFGEHIDVIPGHPQWGYRRISGVAYLNDDCDGGEIEFTRQGITLKPPAGSIILFPSDFTYPHASLPVKAGTKYSVVTWFT